MTMVGATAFYEVASAEARIKAIYDRVQGDPSLWAGQPDKRTRFRQTGFHFTEDNESVRDALLTAMGEIEFRAYAAYAKNDPVKPNIDLLVEMYGTLLHSVLARYRDSQLTVVFEENSAMDSYYGRIWAVMKSDLAGIESATAYRGTKRAPCLAVTDYVLGVTRAHLGQGARDFHRRRFAALGNNLAYLIDFDDDRHLGGRKHPIV